jgi:hypothetical protein
MAAAIQMPRKLWEEMIGIVSSRLEKGSLDKPIVFALYTKEQDHHEVIDYREIPTVEVRGKYPDDYTYQYPGIGKMDFYSPKGTGKWFSGTLVVGDGTDLDEDDKRWMVKEQLDFRIKMDINSQGHLSYKAYFMDFPVVSLNLT